MRGIVVLLAIFVLSTPAVGRGQALPRAVLGAPTDRSPVLPAAGTPVSSPFAFAIEDRFSPRVSEPLQEERRPSLLQHIALGALGGFVVSTGTSVISSGEFHEGFSGLTAVLGALAGTVIWNIRVMS